MSNAAKPCFSSLLDGSPGNKFDARQVLSARRDRRRELLPWVAIQNFGLRVDETMAAPTRESGAADASGDAILTQ